MSERIQTAPGVFGCCDAGGRLIQLAYAPTTREMLIRRALAQGEGPRHQIAQLIADLIAAGQLIELDEDKT